MDKKILTEVSTSNLGQQFPTTTEITVDHLCIGSKKNYYSTIVDGTSRINTYHRYYFGFGVTNHVSYPMRIQFTFRIQGEDEYSSETKYAWEDVKAGEKKRIWAKFNFDKFKPFKKVQVIEIGLGKTPQQGGATWTTTTQPNKSIFELLNLGNVKTHAQKRRKWWIILIIIVILLLWFAS